MDVSFFIAGLFAGASIVLVVAVYFLIKLNRKTDSERMLWCNKALVREGQTRVFSDAAVATGEVNETHHAPKPAKKILSYFRSGLKDKADSLNEKYEKDRGSALPPDIRDQIAMAAEKIKAGVA